MGLTELAHQIFHPRPHLSPLLSQEVMMSPIVSTSKEMKTLRAPAGRGALGTDGLKEGFRRLRAGSQWGRCASSQQHGHYVSFAGLGVPACWQAEPFSVKWSDVPRAASEVSALESLLYLLVEEHPAIIRAETAPWPGWTVVHSAREGSGSRQGLCRMVLQPGLPTVACVPADATQPCGRP